MTVCVGAICDNGKGAVLAADEMVTFGPPMNLQTEPPAFSKINSLTCESVYLFSGTVSDGEQVFVSSRAKAAGAGKQPVVQVAETVKVSYVEHKRKRIEETIIQPLLGTDFAGFRQLAGQSAGSQILQQVLGMISLHNLQIDILISGFDDTGHHLFIVTHPGILQPADMLGFIAIGIGALHAAVSLSLAGQTKATRFAETVLNIYKAKKAAEVAPGVGRLTDMVILRNDKINIVGPRLFEVLEDYCQKPQQTISESERSDIEKACNDHIT